MKVQEWLDQNYPKENRSKVSEIYLNEPTLEGELDLGDFTYENVEYRNYHIITIGVKVLISHTLNEKKLTFKKLPKEGEIIKLKHAQNWLDYYYPKDGFCKRKNENSHFNNFGKTREQVTRLVINNLNLEGTLNLESFVNLTELVCSSNKLTSLILLIDNQINSLSCWGNLLEPSFLFNLSTEKMVFLELPDHLENELVKHKRIWEKISREDFWRLNTDITYITLLVRYQKTNKKRFQVQTLQEQLKELEENLKQLELLLEKTKKRNAYLEIAIEESKQLVNQQENKTTLTYLQTFNEEDDKDCKELIKIHYEYLFAKKERKGVNVLFKKLCLLRKKIEDKLGEKFIETVETILTDFTELYQYKWTLEQQTKEKELIPQYQAELEALKIQHENDIANLNWAIKNKVDTVEYQRLIANTNQTLSRTISLIEDNAIANWQLTIVSSSSPTLFTQQLTETLEQTTSLQAQIQASSSSSYY